jgi:hypothetical protein
MFDVVALLLTTYLALKFWWIYLGLHDQWLLVAVVAASAAETMRRVVVAKRHWQRPATFFSDRRSDLLAAILLGTGPWPVLPAIAPPLLAQTSLPVVVRLLVVSGVVALSIKRLAVTIDFCTGPYRRTPVRQLRAVPTLHSAMLLLPSAVSR